MRPRIRRRAMPLVAAGILAAALAASCGSGPAGPASAGTGPKAVPARTGLAGTWTVAGGSQVGYRVQEQFVDQPAPTDAIANTSKVSGGLTIDPDGANWIARDASFTADLTALRSVDSHAIRGPLHRDSFVGPNFLDTGAYPTASFRADPLAIPASAAGGAPVDLVAHGSLTVHGQTHTVAFPLQARLTAGRIDVTGAPGIDMADYGVRVPSLPFTKSDSHAVISVNLVLQPGA